MTSNITSSVLALACLAAQPLAAEPPAPGMQELSIPDPDGNRGLSGFVWYPTDSSDPPVMALGNGVWQAIPVLPDAPVAEGQKPLLVLSHGMFGNARNQAWLASAFAGRGYVVAAIDHPGTSTFQRDPDDRRALWERPRDISRTIDHLLAGDLSIDPDRIYMAGHSLGGFTAVLLAGGRYDPARIDADCAANPDDLVCGIFGEWGVARTPEDRAAKSADLSDPRIAAVAVFDLGGTQSFGPESLGAIETPMLIIGAPQYYAEIDLDRESRQLAASVPGALYLEPESVAHMDFLGECTEKGLAILMDEEPEDAFVCEDGTDGRRADHAMIVRAVEEFIADL